MNKIIFKEIFLKNILLLLLPAQYHILSFLTTRNFPQNQKKNFSDYFFNIFPSCRFLTHTDMLSVF